MKHIFKYTFSLVTSLTMFIGVASAQTPTVKVDSKMSPVHLEKVANKNADGTYTLRLDSFVTGYKSNITTSTTSTLPLDIVLVLDMSGSMKNNFTGTSYSELGSNSYTYNNYTTDYYYKHTDGNYYKVSRSSKTFDVYSPRPSQDYNYNNYTTQYYYKDGDNYYLVSRETADAYTSLGTKTYTYNNYEGKTYYYRNGGAYYPVTRETTPVYTSIGTQSYSYNTVGESHYILYNNNYYPVKGYSESSWGTTYYYLSFTVNGSRRYLRANGKTTTTASQAARVRSASDIINTSAEFFDKTSETYSLIYTSGSKQTLGTATSSTGTIYTGVLYEKGTEHSLTYTNGSKKYLRGSSVENAVSGVANANTSTIWTGVLYQKETKTEYLLSYNAGGVTYYLSGTDVLTNDPQVANTNTSTIWTGVLYRGTTTTQTRLAALKAACSDFVDKISGNSPEGKDAHQIAIVTFAGEEKSKTVKTLTSDFNSLKTTIGGLQADGGTYPDEAMTKAKDILNAVTRQSAKLVIMFTDGVPAGRDGDPNDRFSDRNTTQANSTIAVAKQIKAINKSYDPVTKTNVGIQVYTIGIFETYFNDIATYMNHTSSNYPSASSMTNGGTRADSKYFMKASSADELQKIFGTIASSSTDISNTGAGEQQATTENNVTVRDIITPAFVIPADKDGNVDLSKVKVYTAKSTGVTKATPWDVHNYSYVAKDGEGGYTWGEETLRDDLTVEANKVDGKTTVNVSGFDFSANWVGYDEVIENNEVKSSTLNPGFKLIITIDIMPNPDDEGGLVKTNDPESGIYIGDTQAANTQLSTYPSTGDQFVPMDMTITKSGLAANETAIFKIYQGNVTDFTGEPLMRVAVKADANGNGKTTVAKLDIGTPEAPITYTVVEESNWTYSYNNTNNSGVENGSISKPLFTATVETDPTTGEKVITSFTQDSLFEFQSDKKTSNGWDTFDERFHDENSVNNIFIDRKSLKKTN